MRIPLANRLKKRLHVETAMLQDEVVELVYEISENAVLHGGTAVWRCYGSNRFSEDLDFYFHSFEELREKLAEKARGRGLEVTKFRTTENAFYSKFSNGSAEARLEGLRTREGRKSAAMAYEKTDGSLLDVLTLSPEDLFEEKMRAYEDRRLARDFYDLHHLHRLVNAQVVGRDLKAFLQKAKAPVDEPNLKALVYQGAVPTFAQMLSSLRGVSK